VETNDKAPAPEPSAKQAALNMVSQITEGTESIYWAAEEVFRELAKQAGWDPGYHVRLDPSEALILRLAGYMDGTEEQNSLNIRRQVGRVRQELQWRKVYGGPAALAEAKRAAQETAEREAAEAGELQQIISNAQAKLNQLGWATEAARANVEKRLKAREKLAELVPPYIQQRIDAARGAAKRTPAKKRLNELEGRKHSVEQQEQRIREWDAMHEDVVKEWRDKQKKHPDSIIAPPPDRPRLTSEQLRDSKTLPAELKAAQAAYEDVIGEMKGLLSDFVDHGYRGPDPG
jgi:hypothetical protein